MYFIVFGLFVVIISLYGLKTLDKKKSSAPLPPGPRPKPIIGNLWDLPSRCSPDWLHWYKHKDLYGPISSVTVFGKTLIILNEARLAHELLDKRSVNNSSRPQLTFAHMCGWGNLMPVYEYSDQLRASRKIAHQQIGSNKSIARFDHIQDTETSRFLLRVLQDPDHFIRHLRKEAAAIILKIIYGYTIEPHERDPLVDLVDRAMDEFTAAMVPGVWLVDSLPFLRHFPPWLPGGGCTRIAEVSKKTAKTFSDYPYLFTKQEIAKGNSVPSIVSSYLEENRVELGSEEENGFKWAVASLYAGGSETTVSTMATFFLCMALYPQVQRKAQEEIDRVVSTSRLPTFEDRENLPYVNALVKEALRWHPVTPMGAPHMATEDDIYEGYYIPKGATILWNAWAYTHDPNTYNDPMAFKPERFLNSDGHTPEYDPLFIVFGFGRRVCPGRNLADANLYLSIARTLAVYNIAKPICDGKEVDIQPVYLAGNIVSHPEPFDVSIKPRSMGHEELIRSVEEQYPWEKSHAEELRSAVTG